MLLSKFQLVNPADKADSKPFTEYTVSRVPRAVRSTCQLRWFFPILVSEPPLRAQSPGSSGRDEIRFASSHQGIYNALLAELLRAKGDLEPRWNSFFLI